MPLEEGGVALVKVRVRVRAAVRARIRIRVRVRVRIRVRVRVRVRVGGHLRDDGRAHGGQRAACLQVDLARRDAVGCQRQGPSA